MVFALVDCNNFFVSCERIFEPSLATHPTLVLSNNDGCVIARSNEAKALGIKMAQPVYQVRNLIKRHNIKIFSSNFQLYGDISRRIMRHLYQYTPNVEVYSIDEAFLEFTGTQNYTQLGRTIQANIRKQQHVPVSIGFAPTKTLAKVATEIAKKSPKAQGVLDLTNPKYQDIALQRLPVSEIWGVGYRLAKRLHRKGINTAYDLKMADDTWLKQNFSVILLRTVAELRGISCLELETVYEPKKSIMTSRSFAYATGDLTELKEMIAGYSARTGEKLRKECLEANGLMVYIKTNKYRPDEPQHRAMEYLDLPSATSDTRQLIQAAHKALEKAYKEGYQYHKAGVMAVNLTMQGAHQASLFEGPKDTQHLSLHKAMSTLNRQFGDGSVRYLAEGLQPRWRMKQEHRSNRYTTHFNELKTVGF